MAKKKQEQSQEELLEQAMVPESEWPYEVPGNWVWIFLIMGYAECLDSYRKPVNANERANRIGDIPYYGATGQVGWIDDYLTEEHLVLVGEDGAPFFDHLKDKAYIIQGKAWVNNHAHILKSFYGKNGNKFLMHYLNIFDYKGYVNGTTRLKLTQSSMNEIPIPIPLPPIAEQQRIVDRIESLFEKLDQAKGLIQEALDSFENRKAAILHMAFTGELTKKWREENGVEMDSWEEKLIGEYISDLNQGWSPKCESFPSININQWGVIKTTAIQHMEFKEEENKALPKNIKPKTQHELREGDILITRAGPRVRVGVCCMIINIRPKLLLCDKAYRFRARTDKVLSEYLVMQLNTIEKLDEINKMKTGISDSGVNLTQGGFLNIKIKVPTIKEQIELIKILNDILMKEQSIKELCDIIYNIDLMKKSILARAFRGELGTNDPEEESALELLRAILKE